MSIRIHLISLVLFCALGGLALGVFLIDRQYAIKKDRDALTSVQQNQHEVLRLEDQIKQLLIATDLLFGSRETYMLTACIQNAETALKLTNEIALNAQLKGSYSSSNTRTAVLLRTQLESLQQEIFSFQESATDADFTNSNAQLDRVDAHTEGLVTSLTDLKAQAQKNLIEIEKQYSQRQSSFDFLAWGAVTVYLASLMASLWLASRAVGGPLAKLSALASRTLAGKAKFVVSPEGPTEVRSLATNFSELIDSMEHTNEKSNALIQAIPDTLFVVHRRLGIVHIKPGIDTTGAILNSDPDWSVLQELLGEKQSATAAQMVKTCLKTQRQQHSDLALGTDDEQRHFEARATAINENEVVVIIRDLTEKRQAEARIRHMAYHDSLTGLLNRRAFKDALARQLESNMQGNFALFYVDVDRFKGINDTHGHDVGDEALTHVTQCLSSCLRTEDKLGRAQRDTNNLSARMGGDEFVVLLPGIKDAETAQLVATRLQKAVSAPFDTGLANVSVSISIGMALHPQHGEDGATLMHHADLAMFEAKRAGGANSCLYRNDIGDQSQRKLTVETKLKTAIEQGDLFLTYQPKIDLRSREIVGAEALVRWKDGDTIIPPDEFIPVAEETGLILPLGEFVSETAIQQMASWQQQGYPMNTMAINVSAAQLKSDNFYESVLALTSNSGLSPSALNIEITESLLMGQYDNAMRVLTQFREGGFTIAMDDFGTGYSSLSYIKDLPLDILKIDRAFVSGISESSTERAIIGAIIQLGKTLGLRIVAEGIETDEHATFLTKIGCDEAQGYLFSPPVSATAFEELLIAQAARDPRRATG